MHIVIIRFLYCLIYEGDRLRDGGGFESLALWELNNEMSASDWYQLRIIAEGGQFWLFLNGNYVETVIHNGATSGLVGISAWNLASSGGDARYEFTNLTMRAIQ